MSGSLAAELALQQRALAAPASREDRLALLALLEERDRRTQRRKLFTYFPDEGPLRRELYPQHLEFFRLGARYKTRGFMAGNRVGKTEGGGCEVVYHLTGRYPHWWEGHRFTRAIDAWAAGDTKETVRDIVQLKLMGPEGFYGTGLIPGEDIVKFQRRPNGAGALDYVIIKNQFGGHSRLAFKSYDQGREAFQGTEKHLIWLDEESNEAIRAECAMRLGTTNGLLLETFTPLRGLTPVVLNYLGADAEIPADRVGRAEHQALVMAGWDDVPHLDAAQKARLMANCEPHLREARSRGVPSIGAGAIYPVAEDEITVDDFQIPDHWPRAYGLDVGWNCTAAAFGALDREQDVLYVYSCHSQGQQEPSTHVAAIRARGDWIPGTIDPASRGRSQKDGEQLLEIYNDLGLSLTEAENSVESGLFEVHQRLATGRLKVFRSCRPWFAEYRIYHRDEKGHIVKKNDHLMDATRYLVVTGLHIVQTNVGAEGFRTRKRYS